jgi:hypothetical protein
VSSEVGNAIHPSSRKPKSSRMHNVAGWIWRSCANQCCSTAARGIGPGSESKGIRRGSVREKVKHPRSRPTHARFAGQRSWGQLVIGVEHSDTLTFGPHRRGCHPSRRHADTAGLAWRVKISLLILASKSIKNFHDRHSKEFRWFGGV